MIAAIATTTLTLMIVLWPGEQRAIESAGQLAIETERADVVDVQLSDCAGVSLCREVTFRLDTGPDAGLEQTVTTGGGNLDPPYETGDGLRVASFGGAAERPDPGAEPAVYAIVDFERRSMLLLLGLLFAAMVIVVGRIRGAISLVGMLASLAVVVAFVAPAIVAGSDPVVVALVGSAAIMLVTIPFSHGIGAKSVAAMLGTTAAFALAAGLSFLFFELASITGLASEEASFLRAGNPELSVGGLALAGAVIATLGVLDDATISQSSVVVALRRADPSSGFTTLFGRALTVGRDHVSATVNTLVLAYAGASLPLLVLFSSEGSSFGAVINSELVATEIVATLVGSIAIVAAVPLTTALAAALVRLLPNDSLGDPGHHH